MELGNWFIVMIVNLIAVFIIAHVTVDKEFPNNQKVGAYVFFIVLALLYLLFEVFL